MVLEVIFRPALFFSSVFLIAAAEIIGYSAGVIVVAEGGKISLYSFDVGLK